MQKLDFDSIRAAAVGRWVGIFRALGIDVREDGKHGSCPNCGGKDRFRFDDKEGRGDYYCSSCGAGDGFKLVEKVMDLDIRGAMEAVSHVLGGCEKNVVPKEKPISREVFRKLFVESKPAVKSDLVGMYLQGRGLSLVPEVLRYSTKCWEPDTKKEQRAMLAVILLPDGTASTMHRTYLDIEGGKLGIKRPKKLMPVLTKGKGGAIRLFPPIYGPLGPEDKETGENDGTIGVAEGIESAIAATEDTGIPTWSVVSTAMMVAFEPPKDIKHVYIFSDNDKNFAGQKATYALAHKLVNINKIRVTAYVPFISGHDWLDQFNHQGGKKHGPSSI